MKEAQHTTHQKVYDSIAQLPPYLKELLDVAIEQLEYAYAPYSKFHVGAAVLLEDQTVFPGSNQENASYPLCMCGERVALYNAAANKPGVVIKSLAITAKNLLKKLDQPVSPCGACRQVIHEYEIKQKSPIEIILKGDLPQVYYFNSSKVLLPFGFDSSFLH